MLPAHSAAQLQATVDSVALGKMRVGPDKLQGAVTFTVEDPAVERAPDAALSPEALQAFEAKCQSNLDLFVESH